jgi:hypothetical protein
MDDFFNGRECFLAQPEWHKVMRESYNPNIISIELSDLLEDFTYYLSLTPPLVGKAFELGNNSMRGIAINPAEALSLKSQVLDLLTKLQVWYQKLIKIIPEPTEVPSSKGDQRYPMVLEYSDASLGTLFCGYYALAITMQEILSTLQPGLDLAKETNELADKICKSAEVVGAGLFGPYRMGFSLRIAYEVYNIERRTWIRDLLASYNQLYGSIDPNTYPDVEEPIHWNHPADQSNIKPSNLIVS